MRPNQQPAAPAADGPPAAAVRLAVLTLPAAETHVALVRLAALHLAGAAGLDADRGAGLRLALGEAYGQFLAHVPGGSPARRRASIEIAFERTEHRLRVRLRGPVPADWPNRDGLGWVLMSALVGEVAWTADGGVGTLTLVEHLPAAD